ncbi:MAG TPA: hypothetical protein DDY68_00935 [Porphyromonadaceae bacterium]|nr:hypothetical protein [Porphyromonadaceae bacterium]
MEQFITELKKKVEILPIEKRKFLMEFISIFFNCADSGNTALLLGVEDKTILHDLIGSSADVIVEDSAKYLIRINKVPESRSLVRFSFRSMKHSFEQKQMLRTFFRENGNEMLEIERQLENEKIEPLEIKDTIEKVCTHNRNLINALSGEGLVDIVDIDTPFGNNMNTGFLRYIEKLYIVPCAYRPLSQHSATINTCKSIETNTFWNYLRENRITDLGNNACCHNYVFLNHKNDHLLRIFKELMEIYASAFELTGSRTELLLRHIFFVCKNEFNPITTESESRGLENMSGECFLWMKNIGCNPDKIQTHSMKAELYISLLKILLYFDKKSMESKKLLTSILEKTNDSCNKLYDIVKSNCDDLIDDLSSFPKRYNTIHNLIEQLKREYKSMDRAMYYENFEKIIEDILNLSKTFSPSVEAEIKVLKEKNRSTKSEFMNRKRFLKIFSKCYVESKSHFQEYASKMIDEGALLLETIVKKIQPVSLGKLSSTLSSSHTYNDRLNLIIKDIHSIGESDLVSIAKFSVEKEIEELLKTELLVSNKLSNEYHNITVCDELKKEEYLSNIETIKSEICSAINKTSLVIFNYVKRIAPYLEKETSVAEIRSMLLNKAYIEIGSIKD